MPGVCHIFVKADVKRDKALKDNIEIIEEDSEVEDLPNNLNGWSL